MSIFNSVPSFTPPRSRQIQKSSRAQDMEMGLAYPIFRKELVPGDHIKLSMSDVIRSLPMIKPTLGEVDICVNAFFCDYRQVDPNFEDNLTGGETGDVQFTEVVDPAFNEDGKDPLTGEAIPDMDTRLIGNRMAMHAPKYSLLDYMGRPLLKDDDTGAFIGDGLITTPYDVLIYNRIWNKYYRDENVCLNADGLPLLDHDKIGDGRTPFCKFGYTAALPYINQPGSCLKRVWLEKDYLNAVLPKRSKGGPFAFPISGSAPCTFDRGGFIFDENHYNYTTGTIVSDTIPTNFFTAYKKNSDGTFEAVTIKNPTLTGPSSATVLYDKNGVKITNDNGTAWTSSFASTLPTSSDKPIATPVYADLANSVTFTYDEFREIRALQLYSERLNLCGSRYEEFLMSMFSVAPHSDTLREPVWLAGFSQPLVTGEVMQNNADASSPLGNYAGKASSSTSGYFFDYFAKEYGKVMIICHIRPKVLYTQGIDRQDIKRTRFDYFNPLFADLSEQEVLACEAYTAPVTSFDGNSGAKNILGFNPRYSEMYFDKSTVCGDLRDEQPYWVWSRNFTQNAQLNGEFALCKHSEFSDRWAVTDLPPFIAEFNFVDDITRPCKAYPIPGK